MFFEATLGTDAGDKNFKIEINETRRSWKIHLLEENADDPSPKWIRYEISKDDYRMVEDIVNLI